jgi:amino acid adenylation domain-containing protein
MAEQAPVFGEEALDNNTGRTVWWDGYGWSYRKPHDTSRARLLSIPRLVCSPRPALLPLSFAQSRLWFLHLLDNGTDAYKRMVVLQFSGHFDYQALEQAVNTIIQRHEVLRTHISEVDGNPVQVIDPILAINIPVDTVIDDNKEAQQNRIRAAIDQEREQTFDLRTGPVLRMRVLRLAEEEHLLIFSSHHIAFDGWSEAVFNRELAELYEAFLDQRENPSKPLPLQYADFAIWQRHAFSDANLAPHLEYWNEQLFGIPEELRLPKDRLRPARASSAGGLCRTAIEHIDVERIRQFSHNSHSTLYMTLLAAFGVLLARYSGEDDILVGSPIANRRDPQLEQLIGLFVNTLVMRLRVMPSMTFRDLLASVRKTCLEAYEHQDVPFERLVEELAPSRSIAIAPICQVSFAMQNAPAEEWRLKGLKIAPYGAEEVTARNDLEIHAVENAGRIEFYWIYSSDLFDPWRVEQMASHYVRLLRSAIEAPDHPLRNLTFLNDGEKDTLIEFGRGPRVSFSDKTVIEMFEEQAARSPDAPALVCGSQILNYGELDDRVNRLAFYLAERGVKPGVIAGVSLDRSPELVISVLAIMKAGGAYLPLDTSYPSSRLAFMAADAQITVLITQQRLLGLWGKCECGCIVWEQIQHIVAHAPATLHANAAQPSDLAYVIYTSGSTGQPKGAAITHSALSNQMQWMAGAFPLDASDALLQKTPLSFDASVWELFAPLLAGARLVLAKPDGHRDPAYLWDAMVDFGITTLQLVPTMLQAFVEQIGSREPLHLRRMFSGGEALTTELAAKVPSRFAGVTLYNLYGPTETCIQSMVYSCDGAEPRSHVPIGRPISNTQVYVLDTELELVPVGVAGELYLAGAGTARGYVGKAALTSMRFVANPFGNESSRMYRTGDLARWLPDGNLEFLGRADQQVKLRGYRIELGEIETAILRFSSVASCCVHVEGNGPDAMLVAYVVPGTTGKDIENPLGSHQSKSLNVPELRSALQQQLPDYLVPGRFVVLDALPVGVNGKIDRKALQSLNSQPEINSPGPNTPQQELLCGIFKEVLGLERVGIDDNFFALGGHSLSAMRLVGRIRAIFGRELPLATIFEKPTVASLGLALQSAKKAYAPLHRQIRPKRIPLSYAQQRLWFIDKMEDASTEYNMPEALRLRGKLDRNCLEQAINTLVERHESLRTQFIEVDGEPEQVVCVAVRIEVPLFDLSALEEAEREHAITAAVREELAQPFNLSRGPLLRMKLLRLGDEDHVLLQTMHHIVSDGWSMGVFNREIAILYRAYRQGKENPLKPLDVQYADFALWQRAVLSEGGMERGLAYWKNELAGMEGELQLPKDRPRPAIQTFRANWFAVHLPLKQTALLKQLASKNTATLYMTMLAAFGVLLSRYSGQEQIVVGSPIANRQDTKLEELIGFFVNSLAMRLRVKSELSFRELLAGVRRTTLDAYDFQDVPFERLVEELSPQRKLNVTPLFQVTFAVQNAPFIAQTLQDLSVEQIIDHELLLRFDLEVHVGEDPEGIGIFWLYNPDLFDQWRIKQMAQHYEVLLQAVVNDETQKIGGLPLMTDQEWRQVVYGWNDTRRGYPVEKPLHELFEEQVARTPESMAVEYEGLQLTYAELNRRSNQMGHYLRRLGVKPDTRVAICMERNLEMIVALLAVLKAGGAYVPLDPAYPVERMRFMLEDSRTNLLLAQSHLQKLLSAMGKIIPIVEPTNVATWAGEPNTNLESSVVGLTAEHLAYIIYTSGSTGIPKGVMVPHKGVANLVLWMKEEFNVDETDSVVQKNAFNFDASVWEIFLPLFAGGRLVVARPDGHRDPAYLASLIANREVTIVHFIPSLLPFFLDTDESANITSLRHVFCGGEALPVSALSAFLDRFHVQMGQAVKLNNFYGPTETSIGSLNWRCSRTDSTNAPIGRPLANTQVYILDACGEPVPVGVVGELYIGGVGVARGYLNRPEQTAERFVPDPFAGEKGARIYKTGDLGRWLPDGNVEFLGRNDEQVKIRGYRIELGEIEARLEQHKDVREAVVIAREDTPGEKRLVGYIVADDTCRIPAKGEARQALTAEQISEWKITFDETYGQSGPGVDAANNFTGWNSSYTGGPIPPEEMREWVQRTVERILELRPGRVWEIGCGGGLLLLPIAPQCQYYLGTDLSQAALDLLQQEICRPEMNLPQVNLECRAAHELGPIESTERFDVVVLNSVTQYFPDVGYLMTVLTRAVEALQPGGAVFVGDVRSLELLEVLNTSVQLYQAPDSLSCDALWRRVQKKIREESELVVSPQFFIGLPQRLPQISRVEINLKRGRVRNELTCFRYDVVLHVGKPVPLLECEWLSWKDQGLNLDRLQEILGQEQPDLLGVASVPNSRLHRDATAVRILTSENRPATAGDLRQQVENESLCALELEDIWLLEEALPYRLEIRGSREVGACDLLFRKHVPGADTKREMMVRFPWDAVLSDGLEAHVNDPLKPRLAKNLIPELRRWLLEKLPEYMVPGVYVLMESLPLTLTGKLDRRVLPAPESVSKDAWKPPRTSQEQLLSTVFAEALGVERVSIDDNFFAMGGHSLMATRVISRIRRSLGINLPVRMLFEHPTVEELAQHLAIGVSFENPTDSFIVWNPDGALEPLFCLPPVTELGWSYVGLMQELAAERPLYALQSPGPVDESDLPEHLEDVAEKYLAVIRRVQPKGPYHLLGWSFGGIVAHHIACLLQRQKQDVNMLALLDAYPPIPLDMAAIPANLEELQEPELIENFVVLLGLDPSELAGKPLDLSTLVELAKRKGHVIGLFDTQQIRRMLRIAMKNMSLLHSFASGRFEGDVLLFRASLDQPAFRCPERWAPHVSGQIKVHQIACRHADLTSPLPLSQVGRILEQQFSKSVKPSFQRSS